MVSPQARRAAVTVLMTERGFGVTRAFGLVAARHRHDPVAALGGLRLFRELLQSPLQEFIGGRVRRVGVEQFQTSLDHSSSSR